MIREDLRTFNVIIVPCQFSIYLLYLILLVMYSGMPFVVIFGTLLVFVLLFDSIHVVDY